MHRLALNVYTNRSKNPLFVRLCSPWSKWQTERSGWRILLRYQKILVGLSHRAWVSLQWDCKGKKLNVAKRTGQKSIGITYAGKSCLRRASAFCCASCKSWVFSSTIFSRFVVYCSIWDISKSTRLFFSITPLEKCMILPRICTLAVVSLLQHCRRMTQCHAPRNKILQRSSLQIFFNYLLDSHHSSQFSREGRMRNKWGFASFRHAKHHSIWCFLQCKTATQRSIFKSDSKLLFFLFLAKHMIYDQYRFRGNIIKQMICRVGLIVRLCLARGASSQKIVLLHLNCLGVRYRTT